MVEGFIFFFTQLLGSNILLFLIAGLGLSLAALAFVLHHIRSREQALQRRLSAEPGKINSAKRRKDKMLSRSANMLESLAAMTGMPDVGEGRVKVLRGKLIQAGFYDRRAVALFFGARALSAMAFAGAVFAILAFWFGVESVQRTAIVCGIAALAGYFAPVIWLDRRINACKLEHLRGFPDFMDLLVVCSQAGLSMEAGIQRIADELGPSYPSLARNLAFTTTEIRSGKTLSRAIEALAMRLGIEEATSFATLLTQSEELGSSLSGSLRAYSDDMRNKRLMKAEEKAFSLPAKLVVPLTLFVFPTLLVVMMLPVVIAVMKAKML